MLSFNLVSLTTSWRVELIMSSALRERPICAEPEEREGADIGATCCAEAGTREAYDGGALPPWGGAEGGGFGDAGRTTVAHQAGLERSRGYLAVKQGMGTVTARTFLQGARTLTQLM